MRMRRCACACGARAAVRVCVRCASGVRAVHVRRTRVARGAHALRTLAAHSFEELAALTGCYETRFPPLVRAHPGGACAALNRRLSLTERRFLDP